MRGELEIEKYLPAVTSAVSRVGLELARRGEIERALTDRPEESTEYALTTAEIDLSFLVETTQTERFLFFTTDESVSRFRHRLRARLDLVPPDLDEGPGDPDAPLVIEEVLEPPFLVPKERVAGIVTEVVSVLAGKGGRIRSEIPDAPFVPQARRNEERAALRKAAREADADRGIIAFSLEPGECLLIRVAGKDERDGILLYRTAAEPMDRLVVAYSVAGLAAEIRYHPLHLIALAVRDWQAGAVPRRMPAGPGGLQRIGLGPLRSFAKSVGEGYAAARRKLRESEGPARYALCDVEGELRFGVARLEDGGTGVRFDKPAGEQIVGNRARVRIVSTEDGPRLRTELLAPEIILTGEARDRLLDEIVHRKTQLAREMAPGRDSRKRRYRELIVDPGSRKDVVVFLTYEDEVPSSSFLVVWPGRYEGEEREFVFLFDRSEETFLKILGIDEDLVPGRSPPSLSADEYEPFHNFFHAYRIWRSRAAEAIR